MEWIPVTDENKKDIRIGDFISATCGRGIIYKVLKIYGVNGEMLLDVGVCDKHGNIECKDWVYYSQPIIYFDCYLQRSRKAKVV